MWTRRSDDAARRTASSRDNRSPSPTSAQRSPPRSSGQSRPSSSKRFVRPGIGWSCAKCPATESSCGWSRNAPPSTRHPPVRHWRRPFGRRVAAADPRAARHPGRGRDRGGDRRVLPDRRAAGHDRSGRGGRCPALRRRRDVRIWPKTPSGGASARAPASMPSMRPSSASGRPASPSANCARWACANSKQDGSKRSRSWG